MAFPSGTITAYLFCIVLVNMWTRAADGVLIVKPENTHLLAGKVATLNCSTSSAEGVHWYHGTSYIYAGGKLYSPYNYRIKAEVYQKDGTTAFNLVFPSAKPEDAGTYSCIDIQGRGEKSSAEMTVFTADGNGSCRSNMKTDGVFIQNDCNIDPDIVQLSCSVTYYGKNPPQLEWKKVPEGGNSVANTECQTIDNRITCNTSIIGDRQMNGSAFVCHTTGSSEVNISLCRIPVKNIIYAFNGKTTTKSSVGNEVQCNSETSQSCFYKWKHSDTVFSKSRAISPDSTGLYQCETECNIRGKQCIVFGYVYVSDDDSTSCSTGCVVGICLIISILIIVILVFVHYFLLKKEKRKWLQFLVHVQSKSTNERNLDIKSDENGTLQERTSLVESREELETIVDEPKLIRMLITKDVGRQAKGVFGVAILGEELFIVRHECPEIEVFGDLQKLEPKREFLLKKHQLESPWDIQSSYTYNCLYIVDTKRGENQIAEIFRINPDGNVQRAWKTHCEAGRLSITNEANVIVTSLYEGRIQEYSPDGELIFEIKLPPSAGIDNPWVTLKRREHEYLISHGNRGDQQHRVCVIDLQGNIRPTYYFGGWKGSNNDMLQVPIHMATYSDGHILVADKDNSRVVLLSSELKFLKLLFSRGKYLRFPNRVCVDEKNKRLFVCDNQWKSNMKPWNDGRVFVFDMSGIQTHFNIGLQVDLDKN